MHTSNTDVQGLKKSATQFAISENVSRFREGRVYAVLFSDGWLKVGRGRNPESRIGSHASVSAMRNATVERSVVSGLLADSGSAEAELIELCSMRGIAVHGREWFTGVDFDEVCRLFDRRFKGDASHYLSRVRKLQSARVDTLLSAVFDVAPHDRDDAMKDAEDRLKWASSLAHARILERIYLDDMYGGLLFEASESGMSNFGNYAALTVHALDESEIADLFYTASTNPGEALEQIVSSARSMVDAFAEGKG